MSGDKWLERAKEFSSSLLTLLSCSIPTNEFSVATPTHSKFSPGACGKRIPRRIGASFYVGGELMALTGVNEIGEYYVDCMLNKGMVPISKLENYGVFMLLAARALKDFEDRGGANKDWKP